jgi:hypothetical protein
VQSSPSPTKEKTSGFGFAKAKYVKKDESAASSTPSNVVRQTSSPKTGTTSEIPPPKADVQTLKTEATSEDVVTPPQTAEEAEIARKARLAAAEEARKLSAAKVEPKSTPSVESKKSVTKENPKAASVYVGTKVSYICSVCLCTGLSCPQH